MFLASAIAVALLGAGQPQRGWRRRQVELTSCAPIACPRSVSRARGVIGAAVPPPSPHSAGRATGPDIRTDYNRTADFSAYRTFGFVPRPGTDRQGYESLTTQYLKMAVQREIDGARLSSEAQQSPDLLVNFNARLRQKVVSDPAPMPPPGYMGYYAYRGGMYGPWPGYGF